MEMFNYFESFLNLLRVRMDGEYALFGDMPESEKQKVNDMKNYLLSLNNGKKQEIGREDLLKKYSGNYFLEIIEKSGVLGDIMSNLDVLVRDVILMAKNSIDGKCELVEERCLYYNEIDGTCTKEKKVSLYQRYRKSCRNSRFTLECRTLHLKFDYSDNNKV